MKNIALCLMTDSKDKTIDENIFNGIVENSDNIKEIITTVDLPQSLPEVNIKKITLEQSNYAEIANSLIQACNSDYILLLDTFTKLEDETLEEYLELLEEEDYDVIYPNLVLKLNEEEKTINYEDWIDKNDQLIQSLTIEEYLPQQGVLIKKETWEKLGSFEERYGDFAFYAFIYKNLPQLKLKNSDLSYVTYYISNFFIDTSYRSRLLRDILKTYDLKQLFQFLNWDKEDVAMATAYTLLGDALVKYYDYFNATDYYRQALLIFHNQESIKKLIETYILMGLFEEAQKMIDTQSLTENLKEALQEKVNNSQKIVKELENAIKQGNASDILTAANDIISYYAGAPLYNILGIIYFMQKDYENAYKFFYKAGTMNPIDQDILYNLVESAKKCNYESEVVALLERITK